jgi:diketogulonate reductase-like aldo/keto reductase
LLNDPVLKQIAAKHEKTVPQVIFRWQIQSRVIVISKTTQKSRIDENRDVFDFEISEEDLQKIYGINKNKRLVGIPGIQQHLDYPFAIPY